MAQPSVVSYFNTRKRSAVEDIKSAASRKVLILDKNANTTLLRKKIYSDCPKIEILNTCDNAKSNIQSVDAPKNTIIVTKKPPRAARARKARECAPQGDIQQFLQNMAKPAHQVKNEDTNSAEAPPKPEPVQCKEMDTKEVSKLPKKVNAMDKVEMSGKEPSLTQIKQKLTRSSRLAELKASMARFKDSANKLEKIEQKTSKIAQSPSLKNFKSLELEVQLSPQKIQSPEKCYLSPKKNTAVRRNLLNFSSPTKNAVELSFSPSKLAYQSTAKSLTLPFKYRCVAEVFRSVDTVCQIMFNRKETITFKKLKPAVEEMLKKNVSEKHLGQIKTLFPDAFQFHQEKLRAFGTGIRQEQWELVVHPKVEKDSMTAERLLDRRRKFFQLLIEKTKDYHQEFLNTLDPPLNIPREKLTRWHPEFDIEKVPDIHIADLPPAPTEDKFSTGKDVLAKARSMFNCNTRMEAALGRLENAKKVSPEEAQPKVTTPILKGIPKALLEKVRQRQAAKVLETLTRTDVKDKELEIYARLPELARLSRNLFVAEKKSVLPLDTVIEKLGHSFRTYISKPDMEQHLRAIAKEAPGWLVFHEVRNSVFVKLSKNADLHVVLTKLEGVLKEKSES